MREFLVEMWFLSKSVGRNRLAIFGAGVVLLVAVVAIFAPPIATHDPLAQDPYNKLQPPSTEHLMGTDDLGRDVFSRIVYGSRTTVAVAVTSVVLSILVGIPLGLAAGYFGGWLNTGIMRVMDTLLAFPTLILALAIASVLGPGFRSSVIAIAILGLPVFARLACGSTLSIKETIYVLAAKSTGCSGSRIVIRHILPNVTSPIIVQGTLYVAFAILLEAALSFIGLGIPPPEPTWGQMLRASYPYLQGHPWLPLASGMPIFLVVLAINFLGDGLRDGLDPKLKSVRNVA
jgi:peptide/nickel transport system permease protein